ncbi:MAG: hypothetical protein KDA96_23355 [Planctomycetaceae bacterium]|nr:hypothetical protein [Planctomycetaceae bacterium]MCA9066033.1 hypothetical protein [Planctomycetaceae bacterium]
MESVTGNDLSSARRRRSDWFDHSQQSGNRCSASVRSTGTRTGRYPGQLPHGDVVEHCAGRHRSEWND